MEYSRFAVEATPAFRAAHARLEMPLRLALALRLDRLRRGQVGNTAALGHGVFELRQAGLPAVHVQRRAARVIALCLGQPARVALALAAASDPQARHPLFDAMQHVADDAHAALYVELALAGDPADVIEVLNQLARARASGLRALSRQADLVAVARRIAALGLRLRVAGAE